MVGFLQSPITEDEGVAEETGDPKIQSSSDFKKPLSPTLQLWLPELEDFSSSFSDSFLDFESINCWFGEGSTDFHTDHEMSSMGENTVDVSIVKCEPGAAVEGLEVGVVETHEKDVACDELGEKVEYFSCLGIEEGEIGVVDLSFKMSSELVKEEVIGGVSTGEEFSENLVNLGSSIEERMGKVSLYVATDASIMVNSSEKGDKVNVKMEDVNNCDANCIGESNGGDVVFHGAGDAMDVNGGGMGRAPTDEDGSDSDAESADESSSSSSSSSSASSSDAEDELDGREDNRHKVHGKKSDDKKGIHGKKEVDVEEGEFLAPAEDEIAAWGDNEDDDGVDGFAGPILSKNEIKVLPIVPSVTVTLQPHHQTLQVGIISSIMGVQVIVEGIEKHNPLNEGSVLWITRSRSPLGIVDEIFGPVKNPYYIVRYNSESEVPTGIQPGTLISFVSEFADHVLNDKSLYQKGYDASGENDEELTDELEFSDDEKEAEHKRMLKMKKRGTEESTPRTKRKDKIRSKNQRSNWKCDQVPAAETPSSSDRPTVTEHKLAVQPVETSLKQEKNACFPGGNQGIGSPFPVRAPGPGLPGFVAPPNGIWGNGFLGQQPLSVGLSSGLAANCMPWMQQNPHFQLQQAPLQTGLPFQQPNFAISGWPSRPPMDLSNFRGFPAFPAFVPGFLDQNLFSQSQIGTGLLTHYAALPQNVTEQVLQSNGSEISNNLQPSSMASVDPQNFNPGHGGGRGGHHRGRGGRGGRDRGRGRWQHRGGRHYGGGRGTTQNREQ